MTRRALGLALVHLCAACDGSRPPRDDAGPAPAVCALPPPSIACATFAGTELPFEATASTEGGSDGHGGASCGGGGGGASDVAFLWAAPRAGRFEISTEGSDFDTILYVRAGACDGPELACNDDVPGSQQARVTLQLDACQVLVVVVDGFDARAVGSVRLSITARERVCDDGDDDDGDGLVDCDDVDDCRVRACIGDGDWPASWADFEWRVLEETNRRRSMPATCGGMDFGPAAPLEMNPVIRTAARLHSSDMAAQDYFMHDSLDGRTFADRMRGAGFGGPGPWGENIAAGAPTPERVVQGWMTSPGHCANIMNPRYRTIGVGYAFDEDPADTFGHYWTQDFAAGH